jgi:PDZ domain
MNWQVPASAILVSFSLATGSFSAPPTQPTTKEIAAWIEQLGSRGFAEREAAAAKLRSLDYLPLELKEAAESPNAEIAFRAKAIVREIRDRLLTRHIEKCVAPINKIGLDFFVERMTQGDGYATEDRWRMIQSLADGLSDSTTRLGHAGFSRAASDWAKTPVDSTSAQLVAGSVPLGGNEFEFRGLKGLILLSPKSMPRLRDLHESIVIILGDCDGAESIYSSLLICTGKIGPITRLVNCIVLSPDHIDFEPRNGRPFLHGSFIQANEIRGERIDSISNTLLNSKVPSKFGSFGDQFLKSEQGPLQLVKMFDPASLGLKTTFDNGQTRIASLDAKSAFAKAGLRSGDELLAVNKAKWSSNDQFRIELRKALVRDSLTLKVRRGNQDIELRLRSKDVTKDD